MAGGRGLTRSQLSWSRWSPGSVGGSRGGGSVPVAEGGHALVEDGLVGPAAVEAERRPHGQQDLGQRLCDEVGRVVDQQLAQTRLGFPPQGQQIAVVLTARV